MENQHKNSTKHRNNLKQHQTKPNNVKTPKFSLNNKEWLKLFKLLLRTSFELAERCSPQNVCYSKSDWWVPLQS